MSPKPHRSGRPAPVIGRTRSISHAGSLAACLAAALGLAAPASAQIAAASPDPGPAVAATGPQSPGEAAQSLRELVARYFAWRGPAFAQLQTIHERLQIDAPAGRAAGGLWMDRDGRMRRETDAAGAPQVQVATPDGGWRTGADGQAHDDPGAAERARRYTLLEFGDALTARGGASVALAGAAELEDHTWSVVRVTFGDADTYEALLDPATGGLCCYRITEQGVTRTVLFGEWRLVDGVRMPFAELTRAEAETGARISAVELNRALDPSLFARPKAGG